MATIQFAKATLLFCRERIPVDYITPEKIALRLTDSQKRLLSCHATGAAVIAFNNGTEFVCTLNIRSTPTESGIPIVEVSIDESREFRYAAGV